MTYLYRFENNNRSAQIELVDERFDVHFYENTSYVGTIEYPDKSYHYVQDAAHNWVEHIMKPETVKHYAR